MLIYFKLRFQITKQLNVKQFISHFTGSNLYTISAVRYLHESFGVIIQFISNQSFFKACPTQDPRGVPAWAGTQRHSGGQKKSVGVAAKQGAQMVVLPECFQTPYGTSYFPEYAEVSLL